MRLGYCCYVLSYHWPPGSSDSCVQRAYSGPISSSELDLHPQRWSEGSSKCHSWAVIAGPYQRLPGILHHRNPDPVSHESRTPKGVPPVCSRRDQPPSGPGPPHWLGRRHWHAPPSATTAGYPRPEFGSGLSSPQTGCHLHSCRPSSLRHQQPPRSLVGQVCPEGACPKQALPRLDDQIPDGHWGPISLTSRETAAACCQTWPLSASRSAWRLVPSNLLYSRARGKRTRH